MYQIVSLLSDSSCRLPSEDVIGYTQYDNKFKAWAIDGASCLGEHPFTTFQDKSDALWFASALSQFFTIELHKNKFDPARLQSHLEVLKQQYVHLSSDVPIWAYPAAACTIIEIEINSNHLVTDIYHYADCFALIGQGSLNQPKSGASEFHSISSEKEWRPYSGFSGETLDRLRQRRVDQQHNLNTTALTLNPVSATNCRHIQQKTPTPCHILLGTDGLSRIWEHYDLVEESHVIDTLAQEGLPSLFRQLREYEMGGSGKQADMKSRDDAAGLHIFCV